MNKNDEKRTKYGVFITRAQPIHAGHMEVITKAKSENDIVIIVMGSADKCLTERNPFDKITRQGMISNYMMDNFSSYDIRNEFIFISLDDLSADIEIPYNSSNGSDNTDYKSVSKEWGSYLYYNIISNMRGEKDFTLYYNDDLSIVKEWFSEHIWKHITLKSFERSEISSSKVRDAIIKNDKKYLKVATPYLSINEINAFKETLLQIKRNEVDKSGVHRTLVIVDTQNDFIDGALGNKECLATVPKIIDIIKSNKYNDVIITMDTHSDNYLETQEGEKLPVPHCIKGTEGWKINDDIMKAVKESFSENDITIVEKPTFGAVSLLRIYNTQKFMESNMEYDFVGFCTGICVISNVMIVKAALPEAKICVIEDACACVTPESHKNTIEAMKMCQIDIIGGDNEDK